MTLSNSSKLTFVLLFFCSVAFANPTPPPLTVMDEDGTPTAIPVYTMKFTNGTVTDNGDTSVSIAISGSGEANTSSNSGTGNQLALPKNVLDLPFRTVVSGDNVTIATNATDITVNVSSIPSSDVTGVFEIGTDTNLTASTGITLTGPVLTTNDGEIDHNSLNNYVANEHIDWTSTAENLDTSGTIEGATVTEGGNALYNSTEAPSHPGAGTGSERFGLSSVAGGYEGLAVGKSASAPRAYSTSVGNASRAGGAASGNGRCVALGYSADAGGSNQTDATALGYNAHAVNNYSIALGSGSLTTASSQMVVGFASYPVNDSYWGEGVTSATPQSFAFNATGGSGSNIAGGDLILAGGKGTGNADGGNIILKVATEEGSGSTLQSLAEAVRISEDGFVGIANDAPTHTLTVGGTISGDQVNVGGSNNELRFYEGANYVGFEAPALSSDQIWVFPATDAGSAGQVIKSNGSGTLYFAAVAAGGGGGESLAATLAIGADASDLDITSMAKLEGVDANTYIDMDTTDIITTKGNIIPSANGADDLGTDALEYNNAWFDGTMEADAITEGGQAVSNDTEIEAVVEPLIDTLANLSSVGGQPIAFADAGADAFFGWDDAGGAQYENLTDAEAMTIIGGAATDLDGNGAVAWGNITAGELADNTVDSDDFVHEDWGEVTNASGSVVIDDSVAVTSWNLTTPTITTSIDLPAGAINTATEIAADIITHAQILDSDQTVTMTIYFEDPVATDDFKSIWANKTANDFLITEIWGESDQTVNFDLQVDDGSPADVSQTDISPAAGEAEDTSMDGNATVGAGEELDLAITSVSGTPTWVSIAWTGYWVD